MWFNVGDLIILGLVALILIIYRQLDRNNRSLEKVKRLGDKLMTDLEAVTQEKVAQLKDMAIEVDVHQQASKKAMERLQAAEDGLDARSAQFEDMQTRIDSYDAALRELISMTQKADENISRLRDESAYIDKVGRRIRQAAGQLQELQNRIPQMLGDFETSNRGAFETMRDGIVTDITSQLNDIQNRIESTDRIANENIQHMRGELDNVQEDLSRRADAYRRAFEEIERDYHQRLEELARKSVEHESAMLGTISQNKESTLDAIAQNKDRLYSEIQALQSDMADRAGKFRAHFDEIEQDYGSRLDTFIRNGVAHQGEMFAAIAENKQILQNELQELYDDMANRNDRYRNSFDAVEQEYTNRLDDIVKTGQAHQEEVFDAIAQNKEAAFAAITENKNEIFAAIADNRNAALSAVAENKNAVFAAIEGNKNALAAEIEDNKNMLIAEIGRLHDDMADRNERYRNDFEAVEQEYLNRLETVIKSGVAHKDEIFAAIDGNKNALFSELAKLYDDMAKRNDSYRSGFDAIEHEYLTRLEDVSRRGMELETESLQRLTESVNRQLEERHRDLRGLIENSQLRIQAQAGELEQELLTLRDRMTGWEQEVADRITGVQQGVDRKLLDQEATMQEGLIRLSTFLSESQDEILRDLKMAQERSAQHLVEFQGHVRHMISDSQTRLEQEIGASRDEVGARLAEAREANIASTADLEQSFRDHREKLENELLSLTGGIDQTRADMERQIEDAHREDMRALEEFQGRMSGQVEQLEGSIYQVEKALEEKLVTAQERGKTLADTLLMRINQDVDNKTESMREAINQRVEQVNASVKASHDQIDDSFNELRGRVDSWIDASKSYMANLESQVRELNESSRQANIEHKNTVETHIAETRERLDSYEHGLSARVAELENIITNAERMVDDQFNALHQRARDLAASTGRGLDEQYDKGRAELLELARQRMEDLRVELNADRSELESSIVGLRGEIQEWAGRVRDQVGALEDESQQRQAEASQLFDTRISELNTTMVSRSETVRDRIVQDLKTWGSEIEANRGELDNSIVAIRGEIQEWSDRVNTQISGFESESLQRQSEAARIFQERVGELDRSMKTEAQNVRERIAQNIEGWNAEVVQSLQTGQNELLRAKEFQDRLQAEQSAIGNRIDELRQLSQRHADELRKSLGDNLSVVQRDMLAELENHASTTTRRIETAGRELADQAKLVGQDLDTWKDALSRQIDELRGLAQGLHADTLGGVQERIAEVQKQAQDLYGRIQTEVAQSLSQYEGQIMGLMGSTESDIRRIQALSAETQARITGWQEQLARTEAEIARDVQEVRDNARAMALKGTDDMRVQVLKRQDEVAQALGETIAKLKSDIAHSRGDVEQDVAFLNQQIDQWKATFQDHLKVLQENSKNIEEQAIAGLKDRIEGLREEARQLTRKAQEEFATNIAAHQGQIQTQLESYQADFRRVQVLNKDVQNQIQAVEAEIAESQTRAKDEIMGVQAEVGRLASGLKETVQREIEERHKALLVQVKQVLDQIGGEVGGSKTALERELALIQQQVETSRNDMLERIKALQSDGANLRRETMAGFQERVDALRDEARKLTGNVKGEITQLLTEHQAQVEKQLKTTEDEVHRVQDLHATSQLRFNEIIEVFAKADTMAQKEFESLREKTRQLAEVSKQQVQADIARQREEVSSLMRQNVESLQQELGQSKRDMQAEASGLATEFEHYSADLRERFEALAKQGLTLQEQTIKAFQGDLDKMRGHADGIAQSMQEQASKSIEIQRATIAQMLAQTTEDISRTKTNQNEMQAQLAALREDISKRAGNLEQDIVHFAENMGDKIRSTTEEYQQQVIGDVERRLKDYEKEIGYRIEKIETVNDDIDNLESNLRESMDRLTQRLKGDLEKLGQDMHKKREEDLALARKDIEGMNLQMIGIEREIEDLKKRAYDNVNQTLKVFEDEFFVDLKERSDRMDQRFEEWRGQVNGVLQNLETSSQIEREKVEERYGQALNARLNELSSRLASQYEKIEAGFGDFQASLQERMVAAQNNMQSVETGIKDEIQNMQTAAIDTVQREFVRMNQEIEGKIRGYEREVEARLLKSDQDYKAKTADLQSMLEGVRSDMTIWQSQTLQTFKNSEGAMQQDLATLRSRAGQTINEIKEDFVKQRDDLVAATGEERQALKQDIALMGERVQRLQSDIEYKTKESLDLFAREYQTFQSDFQRFNNETKEELEDRIKDFRGFVTNTREEFEGMQRRLFSKVDEDAKALDVTLREIDKRIKGFITQTKVFERADALKDNLTEQMNQMRTELANLEEQRKSILDLDPYLAKVRKMAEEITERMNKLMAEKRRLDGLDEDYKKLINISQVVDQKLAQVTASHDTLTEIQLSLRHLEEVQKEVEGKFDRLERKGTVLDATADGIEKNFQYLQDMEGRVGEVRSVVADLPRQVQDLTDRVTSLSGHKKDADQALKNMVNLDKILKDVENRIDELNKARDWIARTETRFNEINREADDKLSILSTLAKKDLADEAGKNGSGKPGGPTQGARDVVVKLAQQGWRVDEIARTTKLSRGEVELILEMGGASK